MWQNIGEMRRRFKQPSTVTATDLDRQSKLREIQNNQKIKNKRY